jgi:hypothetical protein
METGTAITNAIRKESWRGERFLSEDMIASYWFLDTGFGITDAGFLALKNDNVESEFSN